MSAVPPGDRRIYLKAYFCLCLVILVFKWEVVCGLHGRNWSIDIKSLGVFGLLWGPLDASLSRGGGQPLALMIKIMFIFSFSLWVYKVHKGKHIVHGGKLDGSLYSLSNHFFCLWALSSYSLQDCDRIITINVYYYGGNIYLCAGISKKKFIGSWIIYAKP